MHMHTVIHCMSLFGSAGPQNVLSDDRKSLLFFSFLFFLGCGGWIVIIEKCRGKCFVANIISVKSKRHHKLI